MTSAGVLAAPAAASDPVLDDGDRRFFDENGYVVAREVVPRENCEALVRLIWEFLGMRPDEPDDWYRPPHKPDGMVELYQHQALWDNRQAPRVHRAFADLWGTERLWVSIDRVNMKPPRHPAHPDWDRRGFGFIHWDFDTRNLDTAPFQLQGVLALEDTTEDMGGFQCIPGFHKDLEKWIAAQPPDRNPQVPDLDRLPPGMRVTPIPARAGDLIIWNSRLAHGNGQNQSDRPRFAQYIAMRPAPEGAQAEAERRERIRTWENCLPPDEGWATGDGRGWEQRHSGRADLTALGRRLLGLDPWEAAG